jgi:nucleotide-binding universal stress UspA family protein
MTIPRAQDVVVGVDGSMASRAAVRWAVEHAHPGDRITLLHVWQPSRFSVDDGSGGPDERSAAEHCAHRELQHAEFLPRADGVTLSCRIRQGDAGACLVSEQADLLVVGAGRHGRLVGKIIGSASSRIDAHCGLPFVVVPCPIEPGPGARPGATEATGNVSPPAGP